MKRENAKRLEVLIEQFVRSEGLADGLLRVRIFEAWDIVVGADAARCTGNKFFKDGKLFCTIDSSVIRSQLWFQRDTIKKEINSLLSGGHVKEIILK